MIGIALFTGCAHCNPTPVSPSVQSACDNLRRLQCPEGTPQGTTCEDSMARFVEAGTVTSARLSCIVSVSSADGMPLCNVKCKK